MKRRTFLTGVSAAALGGAGLISCSTTPRPVENTAAETAFPPIGRLVDVNGLNVHVTDAGRGGGRPVVLIHGASGNVRDWNFGITEKLGAARRVVAMDRPGFGYTDRPDERDAWRPENQAKLLRRAARRMKLDRPILVGHSWGAPVALAWALDAPDEVTGVVTASGAVMPWGGLVSTLSSLGIGDFAVDYYVSSLSRRADDGAIDDFLRRGFAPQPVPPGYAEYVGAPLALRERTLKANAEDLKNLQEGLKDLSKDYGALTVPLRIMHGAADRLLDIRQHAYGLASVTTQSEVTPLPGVGHMSHHARPDVLARLIQEVEDAA